MRQRFFDIAFTPAVQAEQARRGSRAAYASASDAAQTPSDRLSPHEIAFLEARDSFYLASVSETGWPYVQHRGGAAGFVRQLDDSTLGWAEYAGNRQYISVGNTATNDRVALFFMDYPHRRRLKILGRMRVFGTDERPDLSLRLGTNAGKARIERLAAVKVEAFDWNCPQHITQRFTLAEIEPAVAPLRERIAELEAQLAAQGPAAS